ncbi:cation-transporting P-type ATPase [Angustibacter sp. Root456]|uniref:cation-translocating P-type ATPase n=1 Tax=Angustibacter sp. Root456 TaxID=1736539 RepID=UPI0006FD74ED|nr:cation-transporting P-type ATPase [Angustibacter sp. Root456]KQX62745.1 haloacid dehalogenase [Angustibacter sp. Root456]
MDVDQRVGLSDADAAARLAASGPNLLPRPPRVHPLHLLGAQLVHFFAVMLWVAAGLALLAGMPALSVAIAVVVLLNGGFSFAQEYRADRAAERLADLMPARARVRRDGRTRVVDAAELVVDDVVVLEAGDRVGADVRLLGGSRISLNEAMLTGESAPVVAAEGDPAHAGTYVVEGAATAVVTAIGVSTRLAGIATATQNAVRPRSPLARELHRVVRVVAVVAVAVGVAFFAVSLLLGKGGSESFLFAVGVTVALVPEGLLPTVTLSLARAAQRMAGRHALVRRLESVETLGSTTYICTDKTGTLTLGVMSVVEVWTPDGTVTVTGAEYAPTGVITGVAAARVALHRAATSATRCAPHAHAATSATRCAPHAHAVERGGTWLPVGDPMEVALHVLGERAAVVPSPLPLAQHPFDPRRRRSSVVDAEGVHVIGAPDSVLPVCRTSHPDADAAVDALTRRGLRVLAVAHRAATPPDESPHTSNAAVERDLQLLGVIALEDPPRPDVADAIASCRLAGIRIAMVTGDHPATALSIAREVGLVGGEALVVAGDELPSDDGALGELLDRDEVVVARVTPEDKLRIARALQARGHVVAMTGDGVNDGPALRTADIGIAMGASGTDVAREAADMVLLDDHFGTIVAAVELGRSTFANIRRFLTYHLTDNVAELTPFVVWALSGGSVPLAITVLQVLALDIGTDLLPALALGAEQPSRYTMVGRRRQRSLIDRSVAARAFGVLGPAEAAGSMAAFIAVLLLGGWHVGVAPSATLLATASGTAFTAIVLGQLANAFACRSESRWVGRTGLRGNRLLLLAVAVELLTLLVFLVLPPLPELLRGQLPTPVGWGLALLTPPLVLAADTAAKAARRRDVRPQ